MGLANKDNQIPLGFQWDNLLSGVLQYEGSWELCQHVFVVMSRQPSLTAPEPEWHVAIQSRDGAHSVRGRQLRRPQGMDFILIRHLSEENSWETFIREYLYLNVLLKIYFRKSLATWNSQKRKKKHCLNLSFHIISFMGRMAQYCESYEGRQRERMLSNTTQK